MNFSWNSTIDKDATISITASSFNSLVDKISSAYARGNQSNGGASSAKAVNKNETISADKINNLASALWGLGGTSGTQISVKAGDLITASIFQNLATAANDLKYKSSQCDTCNIQCDITCNKCQTGNKCAGGNICVSGNTAFSCCQYTP